MDKIRAPGSVIVICLTIFGVVLLGCITFLAYAGRDTMELSRLVNTLLNGGGFLSGIGALFYAGAAARSASRAEQQTTPDAVQQVITDAVHDANGGGK